MAKEKVKIVDAIVAGVKDKEKIEITNAVVEGTVKELPIPVSVPIPPTTTIQQDLTVAGQRRINLIWELTQAFIAIIVILSNMVAALYNVFHGKTIDVPLILSSSLFLVIGFYFSRTNHAQIGGTGEKPNQEYKGR